jgi:UDP-glucose 4-epimerase
MKYFVTGGAGFIGSHLVDRLMAEGNTVTVYDNLVSGKKDNIKQHFNKPGFQYIQADLLDSAMLTKSMKGHEIVWHLGANTDIPSGNKQIDLDLKNCAVATHSVLEAMRQNKIKQLLFSSSSTVYGELVREVTAEDAGPLLPISLYGAGKLAGEGFISAYCHLFDMRACMFRFGNVLGARMGHGIIYDFIHKLRRNPRELEVLGDGNQEKNYFLVEDCLDGMFCALHNSKKQCDVFNLGSPTTVKVKEIALIIIEEMGLKDVRLRYTGGERGWPGDVPKVFYNVDKINKLGWKAKYSSAEALRIAAQRLLAQEKL